MITATLRLRGDLSTLPRMRIRPLLALGALIASAALLPAAAHGQAATVKYVTTPQLTPPSLFVNTARSGQGAGYLFASVFKSPFAQGELPQAGSMILDNRGRYVFWRPVADKNAEVANLQVQRYRRQPVLTFWEGELTNGFTFDGTWHVLDRRYREIATVPSKGGFLHSVHEFFITKQNTALTTYYRHIPGRDLRAVGGPESHTLVDTGVAEYDIATGRLIRTWSPDGRIPLEDSFIPFSAQMPYDPWHINSIDVSSDGAWLISMRNTHAIYKVNPTTGDIAWTLGGKRSSFALGDRARFAFQHDARWRPNGRITLFDNNCCGNPFAPPAPVSQPSSRGLELQLDENAKTATFVRQDTLRDLVAGTQANYQLLPNGNRLIGWGQQPFLSETTSAGRQVLEIRYPDPASSYRAYRSPWKGLPAAKPAIAARVSGARTRVYMSWNGATEVAAFRVFAGPSSRRLKVVAKRVRRRGFETSALVRSTGPVFKFQALNSKGRVIGTSRATRRKNTGGNAPRPTY